MRGIRTGAADLPLHPGKAPRWLFTRMVDLSGVIAEAIVEDFGEEGFLRRISDPVWFQGFSCVLGFDWHSSGTTTTTCGALMLALDPERHGIFSAGGKGARSRSVPDRIAGESSLDEGVRTSLIRSSRLSAKVDSACVQDGFDLYHHAMFFTSRGVWAVVQQGMNTERRTARRYHWLSERVRGFVDEPHTGICCDVKIGGVLDMTSSLNQETRATSLDVVKDDGPRRIAGYLSRHGIQTMLDEFGTGGGAIPLLTMPERHRIESMDISRRGLETLRRLHEEPPATYEELVSFRGVGPKIIRALALVSNLVYGSPLSWRDPVMYAFAHGGKDGIPFPVDRETYDRTVESLRTALDQAAIDRRERLNALRRLGEWVDQAHFSR